ncbi:MAG: Transcriptional regulator, TrmB [Candidatus Falkowbacteria bacterium GW2011_GWC2_38_22]|uniref:Transcriptional regulator, TrmB n=1 Tax=Candidatus Falkowbacteria bacterium GW2011_GWE1_38_31 TaxID=1618638 RepID=A0A0G0JSQ8_9BACT|nr:MAG: Transcriptional regulator, TrmB [Candidatus Falkowbacteria bacterium GW2011_GWF2_38_1205]KKQ61675.1 MAG: Transcriptional regulator, TrmB [Candidatus Falkowbacteria bacterium GW2011_GWC2_38_22]KKQ63710.1 MAG: Transcriptional regulator, TrmB [Candidatus Falkowbacteria bacterium GW2011_GWF1_38_22]KKQ65874.1 MAG: Transcriptional regulator, TrmB [Candidatus Falkowbacteria bacterium GW2011_GWE2_38_254]KKQ70573.1 MAG: Transcriptional regulator, TrmB [Candidatus Falkowbacteria bacterium GW2011_
MNNEIKNSLKNLGFRNNEIKVYMALTSLGEANAAEIAKKADLPRTTAISILEKLKEDNYLTTHKYRGTTSYWIESPQTLVNIFEHKIDIANSLGELLNKEYRQEAHFPFAETYDTKTGIRQYIEKFLCKLNKNSTIYTIDSPKSGNYAKIFSDKISEVILISKKKRNISTKSLIPFGTYDDDMIKKTQAQNIEIRELPKEITFSASLWLTNDTLTHFSGNPPFLAVVQHKLIVASMKSIYDFFWSISNSPKK